MESSSNPNLGHELSQIYQHRFQGLEKYRRDVWEILIDKWLFRWVNGKSSVLDLGAGHGEFICQITCPNRYAMDLNPDTATYLTNDVVFLNQDCSKPWSIAPGSLDVVFTSNFFEHLRTKEDLHNTLVQVHRALKSGGHLLALGPNIRLIKGGYWDFWDHHIALTERSLVELGELCGFVAEECYAASLPYSMSQGFRPPLWMLRLYLMLPCTWSLFGKQFFVVLKK